MDLGSIIPTDQWHDETRAAVDAHTLRPRAGLVACLSETFENLGAITLIIYAVQPLSARQALGTNSFLPTSDRQPTVVSWFRDNPRSRHLLKGRRRTRPAHI